MCVYIYLYLYIAIPLKPDAYGSSSFQLRVRKDGSTATNAAGNYELYF